MRLAELKLRNFRNYKKADVHFSRRINVLIGDNAQGKTNLLESIYVLALARSHRTRNARDLINWRCPTSQIRGLIRKRLGDVHLELDLGHRGKRAKVNHLAQARLSSYVGQLNVVLFSPDDLSLVKGSPRIRRRFMDMEFGQVSDRYLYNLSRYKEILRQRNRYLKDLQSHTATDLVYLGVLSDQLAAYGAKIIFARVRLLKKLEKWSRRAAAKISLTRDRLRLRYVTSVNRSALKSVKNIYQNLVILYRQARPRELRLGTTELGPHRDDLKLIVNGKNVRAFGSQGQQRTSALSMKLAEINLMKSETGEYPLLLLDDVLSELDRRRQTHLLRAIQDRVQTFLTTTDLSSTTRKLIGSPRIFRIVNGTVKVVQN